MLLTTQNIVIADRNARELRNKYSIRTILGFPFDIQIATNERVLKRAIDPKTIDSDPKKYNPELNLVGLYVESEKFDELALTSTGLFEIH